MYLQTGYSLSDTSLWPPLSNGKENVYKNFITVLSGLRPGHWSKDQNIIKYNGLLNYSKIWMVWYLWSFRRNFRVWWNSRVILLMIHFHTTEQKCNWSHVKVSISRLWYIEFLFLNSKEYLRIYLVPGTVPSRGCWVLTNTVRIPTLRKLAFSSAFLSWWGHHVYIQCHIITCFKNSSGYFKFWFEK